MDQSLLEEVKTISKRTAQVETFRLMVGGFTLLSAIGGGLFYIVVNMLMNNFDKQEARYNQQTVRLESLLGNHQKQINQVTKTLSRIDNRLTKVGTIIEYGLNN